MTDALPDPDAVQISMCGKTWTVVPQRVARIEAGLGDVIAAAVAAREAGGGELTPAAFYRFARPRLYDVLVALIPGMEEIPEWKFRGYLKPEDFDADRREGSRKRYVALADNTSPTEPELEAAFKAGLNANRVNHIVAAVLDPKVWPAIKAYINAEILDRILDLSSSSSPPPSGVSTPTSSLTLEGIENAATASPGPGSSE